MRFRLVIVPFIIALAAAWFAFGCTGQKGDPGDVALTPEPPQPEEQIRIGEGETADMLFSPTLEEKKEILNGIPDSQLTGWDKIDKCEANGNCTHKAAVQQKILYLLNHPSLNPRFKSAETEYLPCITPLMNEILYEISKDPELNEFYFRAMESTDERNSLLNNGLPFVKEASADDGAGGMETYTDITTEDGQFTFKIFATDFNKAAYRRLNRHKEITVPGGRKFDIYYHDSSAVAAGIAEDVLKSERLWNESGKVFESSTSPLPILGQPNLTIFLISARTLSGPSFQAAGLYQSRDGRGYITIWDHLGHPDAPRIAPANYMKYHRGDFHPKDMEMFFRNTVVHELFHGLEYSYMINPPSIDFAFFFDEALPTWFAGLVLRSQKTDHFTYPLFTYFLEKPLHLESPYLRAYGASIFWNYLSLLASQEPGLDKTLPAHEYVHCFREGGRYRECIIRAITVNGESVQKNTLYFGEAALNLRDPYPRQEGIPNFREYDPDYRAHYLPGVAPNAFIHIPDAGPTELSSAPPKMTIVSVGTSFFSINYIPIFPFDGDTDNNYLEISTFDHCKGENACSIFGFKIDQRDRAQYELLFHDYVPDSGELQYTFSETNGEPDLIIIVIARAGFDSVAFLGGSLITDAVDTVTIRLKGKAFSESVHFTIEKRPETSAEANEEGDIDLSFARATGILDDPTDIPLKQVYNYRENNVDMRYIDWDLGDDMSSDESVMRNNLLSSFVPLKEGRTEVAINRKDFNRPEFPPPACGVERRTEYRDESSVITFPFRPEDLDVVRFIIYSFDEDPTDNIGTYSFGIGYSNARLNIPYTKKYLCHACCTSFDDGPDYPRPDEEELADHLMPGTNPNLGVSGTYTDGETVLNFSSEDDPRITGQIVFPEPIEAPKRLDTEGTSFGGLIRLGTGSEGVQFVPPLIDFRPGGE